MGHQGQKRVSRGEVVALPATTPQIVPIPPMPPKTSPETVERRLESNKPETTNCCMQTPSRCAKACRPPPLRVDGWGHARPQCPRAPATAGPPPRLAEAGAGPGAVEGGCQPVLALLVLIDTSLLSFSFSLQLLALAPSSFLALLPLSFQTSLILF